MTPNTIYCADNTQLMSTWDEGCIDLVFADPPFNIGYVYDKYKDDIADHDYVDWTRKWMRACARVLKPSGSFYIAIGDEFAAEVRILGREIGLHLRNWIIWHYTFGQNAKRKFSRSHTHIFYFTKHASDFTFNDSQLRFPSARHTEYQDLRADPRGRLPNDVWDDFPRVCGTFAEREGFHGCQMPEHLLMRIVLASSNPGEVVLDPFVGSGTTAAAAKKLDRRYVGIDLSEEYVAHVRDRLSHAVPLSAATTEIDETGWPVLHTEFLCQLYRETKVTLANLTPNKVALQVIAGALAARCGAEYSVDEIEKQLGQLRSSNRLPKLPNDTEFVAREHVNSKGKKYERKVLRKTSRKTATPGPTLFLGEAREAM